MLNFKNNCDKISLFSGEKEFQSTPFMDLKVIKIDCDGVLRDLLSQMCKVYNEHYNESISPDDVIHFETEKIFTKCLEIDNIHPSEWLFQNHSFRLFFESPMLYKAKEAMDILHEKGYYIVIVTNQEYIYNKIDTLMWLDDNNIYYDSICFTKEKEMIAGDIIVDDNVDNLDMCNEPRKVCINAPYNISQHPYECYDSLYEFATMLK